MQKLIIHENSTPIYPIILSEDYADLYASLEELHINNKKICIVSDTHVAPLYIEEVFHIYQQFSLNVRQFVFTAGEASKNLETVQQLYEFLIVEQFERGDLLVALGGGVVGDLTGYTAATYLRGIDFIQMPTSLLAQVDSSIGGKTGVDFKAYKNMVGAFHQPKLVYINISTLKTLTQSQYVSGMGEILKHGLIKDAAYYHWLNNHRSDILSQDSQTLLGMIQRSCEIKRDVVENDPKEKGERALLNYGHTIGHAIEKLENFSMLHGECVAVGMAASVFLSAQMELISSADAEKIIEDLKAFGLPVHVSQLFPKEVVTVTKSDKKMSHGTVKFVLIDCIGHAFISHDVHDEELLQAAASVISGSDTDTI